MSETDELLLELEALREEIKDAHEVLTRFGVGKVHWSLAGRIRLYTEGWPVVRLLSIGGQRKLIESLEALRPFARLWERVEEGRVDVFAGLTVPTGWVEAAAKAFAKAQEESHEQ